MEVCLSHYTFLYNQTLKNCVPNHVLGILIKDVISAEDQQQRRQTVLPLTYTVLGIFVFIRFEFCWQWYYFPSALKPAPTSSPAITNLHSLALKLIYKITQQEQNCGQYKGSSTGTETQFKCSFCTDFSDLAQWLTLFLLRNHNIRAILCLST